MLWTSNVINKKYNNNVIIEIIRVSVAERWQRRGNVRKWSLLNDHYPKFKRNVGKLFIKDKITKYTKLIYFTWINNELK